MTTTGVVLEGLARPKPDLARADVDLRISANRARFGRSELRDVGFSVLVAGGKGEVAIAEANAFGGSLKARLSAEPSGSGYLTRASAAFTRVDSAALLGELFRSQRFSGEATGEFSFAGQGASVAEVVGSMRGSARVDLANGDISGIDLENALRRLEKQPLSAASAIRTGRTSYRTGLLDLDVAAGVATIRTLEAKGAGVDVMVTGSAILARRLLDITIKARQAGREDNDPAPQLSMDLRGNWDDPNLVIDARASSAARRLRRHCCAPRPRVAGRRTGPDQARCPRPRRPTRKPTNSTSATRPIRMVETALISGVTPRRTCE